MEQSINTITSKRSSIRKKIGVKDYGNIVDYLDSNVAKNQKETFSTPTKSK